MGKVGIICNNYLDHSLEGSYKRAFEYHGYSVEIYAIDKLAEPHIRLGKVGNRLQQFIPIEPWQKKTSRSLSLGIKEYDPDIILITGGTKVHLGTLAFLKSTTKARFIYIWQDPLPNLDNGISVIAPFIDLVATFNSATINIFRALGFNKVEWVPLAADPDIHQIDEASNNHSVDISFVGGWRPEREAYLQAVKRSFPDRVIKVLGTGWGKTGGLLKESIVDNAVYGREYAEILNSTRLNLNIIDETGFPSANMRFFELPISRGFQICSHCPDMNEEYIDMEHVAYYTNSDELITKIEICLSDHEAVRSMKEDAFALTTQKHLYHHRVEQLLHHINN